MSHKVIRNIKYLKRLSGGEEVSIENKHHSVEAHRLMVLKIDTFRKVMNIVQVYALTKDNDDDMLEELYTELEEAIKFTKKDEITIMMGDFNAKVGVGTVGNMLETLDSVTGTPEGIA